MSVFNCMNDLYIIKKVAEQKEQLIQKQEELIESLQTSVRQRDEKIEHVIDIIDHVLVNPDADRLLILAKMNHVLKSENNDG